MKLWSVHVHVHVGSNYHICFLGEYLIRLYFIYILSQTNVIRRRLFVKYNEYYLKYVPLFCLNLVTIYLLLIFYWIFLNNDSLNKPILSEFVFR